MDDRLYIEQLQSENDYLKRQLDEIKEGEIESRKKIENAYLEAEKLKSAAAYAYALELKAVKNFSVKWRAYFSDNADKVKKEDIIDLLKGFLSDVGIETAKETVEKMDKALGSGKTAEAVGEEFEFDLDAVINPSGELDLESLCKELGVYRG